MVKRFETKCGSLVCKEIKGIGKDKLIGSGIILVCVEITENIGDVHEPVAAQYAAHIVKPGVGDAGIAQEVQQCAVVPAQYRGVAHTVDRPHGTQWILFVQLQLKHKDAPPFVDGFTIT